MDVSGQETDWRSANFRQKLVSQIEEAMRKAGVAHNKSSKDMENHVFMKAKTREEYLSLVARLILHFRDIHNKKSQASVSDPMNALQNLTGGPPAGAAGMGMASRAQGAPMGGMSGLGPMGQQMSLPGQQPPGTSGMAPHGMSGVSAATQQTQLQLQQMAQQQQQQQQQFQQQQAALQQQQQQQFQAQQSAMQQQFQVQQQQAAAAAAAQQQQQQQQLQAAQQQQQQHMLKLQMQQQQQNQQQMQQQQQLQRIAQMQLQQQAAQVMQVQQQQQQQQQQIPQQQIQQQPSQQVMQQMQQQQQQVAQAQQSQLPPQSQSQSQPQSMVSQAQAISGQIPSQVMSVPFTQQQLKAMQVRAQLVQQQQQAAAAVQAAQAQAAQMGASGQMITATMARGGMQIRPRFPPTTAVSATPPSSIPLGGQQMPQVSQSSITMMSSPSPVQQAQTPQSMPPPPQPQPSPQPGQPTSQPNSNVSSGPAPSPSSFLPSPSPQPSQSPAAARTPQNFSVPSPGPLNTPGNPNSVMSPASSSQSEEQQYLEKLKQLSKYIEPLRRMINKIDKNEDRKKDLSKMKSLLDILTDPSKRCPLKTLQKCEIALEKLKNDMAVPTPPPPPVPPTKQQYLCQPLLDAVLANIRSPVFNHSLYRTFVPAMTAIHGPPITAQMASPRKRKYEEDERQTIPNVLQGEVARLNPKFLVNLDPSHCSNNGTVHLICKLDDKNLPNVPPLQLSVPADYPDQSPLWIDNSRQYANPFLQSVYQYMTSKLLQLPDKHSVTALLNTWAQSIRQACLSAA
ncbi:mediator of RNA polymerase II transcription subunit 15 isoform X2 [Gopherus flavomarginatus]|uniref:mediator of RNA polymerase II transcription subunit 15 isoform X2 n=1 Tax=Gopherus flavomarginatus TaxID=286002 RepID=UPI0021CC2849|nr:mediator of RNA polymerase II transcription subunit 15 isoform X2 [Gopherus flavomarginatus]